MIKEIYERNEWHLYKEKNYQGNLISERKQMFKISCGAFERSRSAFSCASRAIRELLVLRSVSFWLPCKPNWLCELRGGELVDFLNVIRFKRWYQ